MKATKRFTLFIAALMLLSVLIPAGLPAAQAAGSFNGKSFGEPVKVSTPIQRVSINDGVFGMEDGKEVVYTTVTSDSAAVFNVVDIRDNKLLRSFALDGVNQSWRHAIAPDGTVYIAGIAVGNTPVLWSYSPVTKTVTNHGNPSPGQKSLWSMTTDDKGNVYGGTFDSGKLFKFDPVTREFHDYGTVLPGRGYIRSMAYHDGYIYAGLGAVGAVVKVNVETGEKEVISDPVPGILGVAPEEVPFAYDMAIADGYLAVRFSDPLNELLFYDLEAQEWLPHKIGQVIDGVTGVGVYGFNQLLTLDGKLYIIGNRQLVEVDLTTFEARSTGANYGSSLRGAMWIEFTDSPQFPGKSLVTLQSGGKITRINVKDGLREDFDAVVAGQPNPIHQLETAPNGKIYMTGYPGSYGAVFDPVTDTSVMFTVGQAEGLVALGDYMYFGIYPGGIIYRASLADAVPSVQEMFRIGSEQDRPYMMTTGEGKLIIGTIPDYGKLGGALTIYDPATGEKEVYRNVVQNQSITGLVYHNGLIFGGSNIYGGLDIPPTETEAKMFVWDMAAKQKIAEFTLDIPDLDKPTMITGLTVGPDGLIWGTVDGIIFQLDPETFEIVDYTNVYPQVKNYGFWRPYHPRWGQDGMLYVDLADIMTVFNPQTKEFIQLTPFGKEINFMTIAPDASGIDQIYYSDGANIMKIPVTLGGGGTDPDPQERELPVFNGGFEEPVSGGKIPGWTNPYPTGLPFTVSNELALSGNYSIKIVDTSRDQSGGLMSDPIPAKPGKTYKASANVYMVEGDPDDAALMMYFFDADGKELGNTFSLLGSDVPNRWQTVEVEGIAPEGTASIRLMAYSSRWNLITAYYDDITLRSPDDLGEEPEPEAPAGTLVLSIERSLGSKDQRINVNLSAKDVNQLYAVRAYVEYNPAMVTLDTVTAGEGIRNNGYINWKDNNGKVTILATMFGNRVISENEIIASLSFVPKGTIGETQFTLLGISELAKIDADQTNERYTQGEDTSISYNVIEYGLDFLVKVAKQIGKDIDDSNRALDLNQDGEIDIADLSLVALAILNSN